MIKAGAKAMLAKSYNAVGIQEVLSQVDVPKGSFYHYFSSKEEFGVAIVEYYGEQLADAIEKRLSDPGLSPWNRMKQYFLGIRSYYASAGCNEGCLVAKMATEIADASPRIRIALKVEFDKWVGLFARCIEKAQDRGEISPEHNATALAEFIYTAWEGALIRMQVDQELNSLDTFVFYIFGHIIPLRK